MRPFFRAMACAGTALLAAVYSTPGVNTLESAVACILVYLGCTYGWKDEK